MKLQPLVSVIVVNWNGKKYLEQCLNSLLSQSYSKIEIIFVDNASSDDSIEFVQQHFPNVKIIVNEKNLGFAGGNNSGFVHAKGKYIALLNNDAIADKDWLNQLVLAAEANPDIGMLTSKIMLQTLTRTLNSAGTLVYPDLSGFNRGMYKIDTGQYDRVEQVFGVHGAAAMFRKQTLDEVGFFDSEYFMYAEENDLNWRCQLAGWSCLYIPKAVVYHFWSVSSGGGSLFKLYYCERNRIWCVIKLLPIDMILISILYTLKRFWILGRMQNRSPKNNRLTKSNKFSKVTMVTIILKAWLDALLQLPKFWRKRRMIKSILPRRRMIKRILYMFRVSTKDMIVLYPK